MSIQVVWSERKSKVEVLRTQINQNFGSSRCYEINLLIDSVFCVYKSCIKKNQLKDVVKVDFNFCHGSVRHNFIGATVLCNDAHLTKSDHSLSACILTPRAAGGGGELGIGLIIVGLGNCLCG